MSQFEQYKPFPYTQKTLSNGMSVLLIQDKQLPYISFDLALKVGSKIDPKDKQGLMFLLANIIDKGTKKQSATSIVENIELLGTSFQMSISSDSVLFSVETLSWLYTDALKIFSEIMTQPLFSAEEFNRAQKKSIGQLTRSIEQFSGYTSRAFNRYLFQDHPYGYYHNGTLKSLNTIQNKDIQNFYDLYFDPKQMILSVSGQYPDNIMKQLESFFGSWKVASTDVKKDLDISVSPVPVINKNQLLVIDHKEAKQSEIRMGHLCVHKSHPDYLALQAANIILGGGFSSRLMSRVRVQKGLTYGISSAVASKKELGAFALGLAVRHSKVGEALSEIKSVLDSFYNKGITTTELQKTKQQLKNFFISKISNADNFAQYLIALNIYGIPYTYAEQYFQKINNLTLEDINTAIKKHLHPDKMKILIFTNLKEVKSQLNNYEPITVKNYKDFL